MPGARPRRAGPGRRTGPVGTWVGAHKTLLRAAAAASPLWIFVWGQAVMAVVICGRRLAGRARLIELLGGGRGPRPGGSRPCEKWKPREGRVLGQAAALLVMAVLLVRKPEEDRPERASSPPSDLRHVCVP